MRPARAMLFALASLLLFLASAPSRAERPPRLTAFAVIIGNNRDLEHRRPDLHYADDDAAKYFAILQTIAPDRAFLLADFDDDTARLFPGVRVRAASPTRGELMRTGQEIASRVRAAAAGGAETEVYFVFAGHGDVDQGTGFIELADGRFTSHDLEQWLSAIPFSRAHVILDSCNSFFMLAERRPGGRYYATPEDAARSLSSRLPNVGVFLSTSAEGESFEWSEIQSGVFSHVVRSGLMGAADANGDGDVSYLELAAFVATATADVANPNMRPHVFSRGPGGRDDVPIVGAAGRSGARAFRLSDPAPMRIRLRDRESVPFLDTNEAEGVALMLTVPNEWADGAVIDRAGSSATTLQTFAVPTATTEAALASLQPIAARGAMRGPAEIFQRLFQRPFGPRAVAAYRAQVSAASPPVYGVSREDAARMDLLLGQVESAEHGQRLLAGTVMFAEGAFFGALGATAFAFDRSDPTTPRSNADAFGGVSLGIGALSLAYGVYTMARPWAGERLAADYHEALQRGDYSRAFALANERINALAAAEAHERWLRGIASGVVVVGSTAAIVGFDLSATSDSQRFTAQAIGGAGIVLGVAGIASALLIQSPIERLTNVWLRDPGLIHIQPTVSPTTGGAMFGLVGSF